MEVDLESDRLAKLFRESVQPPKSQFELESPGASSSSAVPPAPNDNNNDDSNNTGDPSKSRFQFVSMSPIWLARLIGFLLILISPVLLGNISAETYRRRHITIKLRSNDCLSRWTPGFVKPWTSISIS